MATQLQLRRGNTTASQAFTGAIGEVTVNTQTNELTVHDGITTGGHKIPTKAWVQQQIENIPLSPIDPYITNCLTNIPQNLIFELNSGILTLKAGSKIYIPNGVGNFEVVTTVSDIDVDCGVLTGKTFVRFYQLGSELYGEIAIQNFYSGSDATGITGVFYNTTTNKISYYTSGVTDGNICSFPLAEITVYEGLVTNINKVFNGFGYIGSTIFVLPGVEGLIPNGRNTDGTLKNIDFTVTQVTTRTDMGVSLENNQAAVNIGHFINYDYGYRYIEEDNVLLPQNSDTKRDDMIFAKYSTDADQRITSFEPLKTTFHAVDYNDFYTTLKKPMSATNCITEIPQDIKLELNNGTLTLKAGSKVYVPNGVGVFDEVVIASDITYTYAYGAYTLGLYYNPTSGHLEAYSKDAEVSGTTPANTCTFYNTSANNISRINNGTVDTPKLSFPIATITTNASQITSIDQIFNGFGYIGSTVFVLPGIKGLAPNGRNADGTLKNITFTVSSVRTNTLGSSTFDKRVLYLGISSAYGFSPNLEYLPETNTFNNAGQYVIVGWGSASSGVITNLELKTAFHGVDYNDTEYIAHQAMPGNRYIDLTIGVSGTQYVAPADGYFTFYTDSVTSSILVESNGLYGNTCTGASGFEMRNVIPVRKGCTVTLYYGQLGTYSAMRFIYANGEA